MEKEIKKKTKKVTKENKRVDIKKKKSDNSLYVIPFIYMFLLLFGLALAIVAFILKIANYIDSSMMITCLGAALILLTISAFIRKMSE